jgi:hypothetical protein
LSLKIIHIICENGLGHFKRSLGLLNQIIKKEPNVQLDIICTRQQLVKLERWEKIEMLYLADCRIHTDISSPGVHWFKNEDMYIDNRLIKWSSRLEHFKPFYEADIVISDNLVAPLKYRPDTLLMGSFLWLDVFEKSKFYSPPILDFIIEQKSILKQTRPNILCVGDVAMPILMEYTNPIKMPWFGQVEKIERGKNQKTNRIAILGGATSTINNLMIEAISVIIEKTTYSVAIPQRIIDNFKISHEKVHAFNFEIEDFQNCDLVICRPGVGTITDCISTQTPMIFIYEADNVEMKFNAEQLERKGVAINIGDVFNEKILLEKIHYMHEENVYDSIVSMFQKIPTNGFEVAANWILNDYLGTKNFNYVDESND